MNGEQSGATVKKKREKFGLMGPAILITLGVLFMIDRMNVGPEFQQMWPVILIVIGLVKLAESVLGTKNGNGS